MSEVLEWVDARAAMQAMIDGTEHAGVLVQARYEQSADEYGQPDPAAVEVVVYETPGGNIGYVDRLDEITLDVYAPRGELAKKVAESVLRMVCGTNIDTPEGFLDTVRPRTVPVEVPYQSPVLSKVTTTLQVIHRPL